MTKSKKLPPYRSVGGHFTALYSQINKRHDIQPHRNRKFRRNSRSSFPLSSPFTALPNDLLTVIAANFSLPDLQAASLVCKSWRDGLQPLREAEKFRRLGMRFKLGLGGVQPNLNKALDSFLKGAALGSTLAMVDAGLMYSESGKKSEAVAMHRRAAELGNPTGQCNLGISYLEGDPPNPKEAVKWLYQASVAGNARAQSQLALCLHQGRGCDRNSSEAFKWSLRAAKGFPKSIQRAKGKWMKKEAKHGYIPEPSRSFSGFLTRGAKEKWMKKEAKFAHMKDKIMRGIGFGGFLTRGAKAKWKREQLSLLYKSY